MHDDDAEQDGVHGYKPEGLSKDYAVTYLGRGTGKLPQKCLLSPSYLFDKFWLTSLETPRMSQVGVQMICALILLETSALCKSFTYLLTYENKFYSLPSQHCFVLHSQNGGVARNCNGYLVS